MRLSHRWSVTAGATILLAAALASCAVAFGIWATLTKNSALFGRQTALAGIYSVVLAAVIAAAAMMGWAWHRAHQRIRLPPAWGDELHVQPANDETCHTDSDDSVSSLPIVYRSPGEASSLINMRTISGYRDWTQLRELSTGNPTAAVLLTWKLVHLLIYKEAYTAKAQVGEDWATQIPLIASRLGATRRTAAVLEDLMERRDSTENREMISRSDALEYIDAAETALRNWLGNDADIDARLRYSERR